MYILVINPGSTSTKTALFDDNKELFEETIRHNSDELSRYRYISDQFLFRKKLIISTIEKHGYSINDIKVIVARGGLVKPIESGVYEVNEQMKLDLINGVSGEHASNLGGLIASDLAVYIKGAKAYIADPVVVDELMDVARISGHPLMPRRSIFHALNQKAIARLYASDINKEYEDLNIIIAHMGGGVSVGAHYKGKVVDVNNALDGDGPFSPERSGSLAASDILNLSFSGKYTQDEIRKMINGKGGFIAHLKSSDVKNAVGLAEIGDEKAALIIDAFCYNISKSIAALSVVFKGKVDAILLTGGIAYSSYICKKIEDQVSFLAPIKIYPGEDEMSALAANGLMVTKGVFNPKKYL